MKEQLIRQLVKNEKDSAVLVKQHKDKISQLEEVHFNFSYRCNILPSFIHWSVYLILSVAFIVCERKMHNVFEELNNYYLWSSLWFDLFIFCFRISWGLTESYRIYRKSFSVWRQKRRWRSPVKENCKGMFMFVVSFILLRFVVWWTSAIYLFFAELNGSANNMVNNNYVTILKFWRKSWGTVHSCQCHSCFVIL